MGLLKSIFTWWDGPTIGTRLWSSRNGEEVGRDAAGNIYYRKAAEGGGRERRWVIYNGENEASRVPARWHGWLHSTHDDVPAPGEEPAKPWIREHRPNPTGTDAAYLRPGALPTGEERARATGDYESWSPEEESAA